MHHEESWVWMSGAPWGYENLNEGEPNQNGNEDCTAFDSQAGYKVRLIHLAIISCVILFQWMDLECNSANHGVPHYAVCEKEILGVLLIIKITS